MDGTHYRMEPPQKGFFMRIETSNYNLSEEALEIWKKKMQEQAAQEQQQQQKTATDSYVSSYSYSSSDLVIPTGTYNASGVESNSALTTTSTTSTSSSTGYDALLSQLSETFRANADSILSTLDTLGLSLEDLQDEDNLQTLADAMNSGAESLGLPTVDNLETLVSQLYQTLSENWDAYFASADESESITETIAAETV